MDRLMNLTGFSSKNKSSNILHVQNELDKKKKTYNSVNLSALPDKGAKLKQQIDDLENLLQTLTLESADNEVSSVTALTVNGNGLEKKKCCDAQCKELVRDESKKNVPNSNKEQKRNVCRSDKDNQKNMSSIDKDDQKDISGSDKDNRTNVSSSDKNNQTNVSSSVKVIQKNVSNNNEGKHSTSTDNDCQIKNVEFLKDDLPFCKLIDNSEPNKFLSFSDLTPKYKVKNDKADVMSSPSFKSWRQTGEVRKTLLTEAKPLLEKNPGVKSSLLNQNLNPVFSTSEECVKKLHKSLATYPDDTWEETDPEDLKSTLMLHQKRGLAWMMWREEQDPKGGILADDMGLGKTLSIIALIVKQKERKDFYSHRDNDFECRSTLIVCSASIIHQWSDEIVKHCEIGALKVFLYHGPKRDKSIKRMKSYDVVLTTYNIIQTEKKKMENENLVSPLFSIKWERIVLDEAHTIKNHISQTAQAIFSLKSFRKWAVTGTPIHNVFKDIYALVKFLQFSPFDDLKKFKGLTDDNSDISQQRRNLLMKSIVLRRTKDQVDEWGKPLVEIKKKTFSLHYIELSTEEQKVYNKLQDKIRNKFSQFLEKTSKMTSLLVLLLRFQQCCNHLSLLKRELELTNDPSDVADAFSTLTVEESSSNSSESSLDLTFTNLDENKLDISTKSTKITELFKELHKVFESSDDKDKSVIVSQWVSMLDIVAFHLKQENISYYLIAGNTKVEDRQKFAHDFNNNEDGAKIMLLSLKAGGVGLNLIGANHLFLLDLHWNPALEMQACDRIHRVGQRKDVTIHKFICKNTIEEKINELQKNKRRIASSALSSTKQDTTRLTIDDYKLLFGIL